VTVKNNRKRIEEILVSSFPQLIKDEPAWLEFMTDELISQPIESEMALFNILGDHLQCLLTEEESVAAIKTIFSKFNEVESDLNSPSETVITEDDSDSDDGVSVGDGACVICHREMPLTKHHLTPRAVHRWHKNHNGMTHEQLHAGISICRDCHDAVHRFISLKDMGFEYNTLEKILEHPKVVTFIPYISKKRPTNKSDKRTWKQNNRNFPPEEKEENVYLEFK